jgi:hypothetical protein
MKKNKFNKEAVLEKMYSASENLSGMEKFYALNAIAERIEKMEPNTLESPYSSSERLNCGCIKKYGCACVTEETCNGSSCQTCCADKDECGGMDELLISFGNSLLENRFQKLFGLNPEFVSSVLSLNPTFFEISDADLRNFEEEKF